MMLETKYELQQYVYLKTDIDQRKRMILAVIFNPSGIQYQLGFGTGATWHHEMEITAEINIMSKVE